MLVLETQTLSRGVVADPEDKQDSGNLDTPHFMYCQLRKKFFRVLDMV
jgi:hypothetical protein